jgi:hypothetical protein
MRRCPRRSRRIDLGHKIPSAIAILLVGGTSGIAGTTGVAMLTAMIHARRAGAVVRDGARLEAVEAIRWPEPKTTQNRSVARGRTAAVDAAQMYGAMGATESTRFDIRFCDAAGS